MAAPPVPLRDSESAGGLPRRVLPLLARESFLDRFRRKGRLSPMLARVPVPVIARPEGGLAPRRHAARALTGGRRGAVRPWKHSSTALTTAVTAVTEGHGAHPPCPSVPLRDRCDSCRSVRRESLYSS
ncbi:MAG: glucokinase [Gemmatimonadaceae bacterium]